MPFEYDPEKSQRNLEKHGIDFEQSQQLWEDDHRVIIQARSTTESRFLLIATLAGKHWSAIFTYRGENIRLISVRRSRKSEVNLYAQN